jgi:hypothetical protein
MINPTKAPLIANRRSKEVHLPYCSWGKRISKRNRKIDFQSFEEALFEGYDGCAHCLSDYNNAKLTGFLSILNGSPDIRGEFILPSIKITFAKTGSTGDTIVIELTINSKVFEFVLKQTKSESKFSINKNQEVSESSEELTFHERNALELFLVALNKRFRNDPPEQTKHVISIGRAVVSMLSTAELPEEEYVTKKASKSRGVIKTRHEKVVEAFENNDPVSDEISGQTVDHFLCTSDNIILDTTNFVNDRRSTRCVYKGESVQVYWSGGFGKEDRVWKKAWIIAGGKDGGGAIGASGSANLAGGDGDLFTGWFYTSADHDVCQMVEGRCLWECHDEFNIAMGDFIFGLTNYIPGVQHCDGNDPDLSLQISDEELENGEYVYTTEHPMAGRKNWNSIELGNFDRKWCQKVERTCASEAFKC